MSISNNFRPPNIRAIMNLAISFEEGTYASYKVSKESAELIKQWCIKNKIQDKMIPTSEMHMTTVYSREPVDVNPGAKKNFEVTFKELKILGVESGVLVMVFDHPYLFKLFDYRKEKGASWDFPEYIPHVTIAKGITEDQMKTLSKPDFNVTLTNEEITPLDLDFSYDDKKETKAEYAILSAINSVPVSTPMSRITKYESLATKSRLVRRNLKKSPIPKTKDKLSPIVNYLMVIVKKERPTISKEAYKEIKYNVTEKLLHFPRLQEWEAYHELGKKIRDSLRNDPDKTNTSILSALVTNYK